MLSIRSTALLMILVPTLVPALALSAWLTSQRVADARAELESRGERESRYLADASALALLVADSETLQRLAASNLKATGAAAATLFLDAEGAVLAAAGAPWEVGMARQCWLSAADCSGGEQRYLFEREVRASGAAQPGNAFDSGSGGGRPELIGRVVLSFDPRVLAQIQRAVLLKSILMTLATLLIASVLAHLFSRRLTVPMQRLSWVVARIRNGESGARTLPAGTGELRELEEGVNAMADRVEAASVELNRRVDEATAELSHALMEREQRNRELDRALEHAAAASRAKDLFLARMSHELRTPLTTVTGYAHLMQQSESPEQRADFYRTLAQASRILLATVDDILIFVKLENGSLRLERREFDLESCIEDAVMMQAPAAHAKSLELVCHAGPGLPARVNGDSLRISQVLSNLISNAIKFTHAGHVCVRASSQCLDDGGTRLLIDVSDTGIGIAPASAAQLFQPFAQADESMTRRFGGSGLGLSISSSLVAALEGRITLHSVPGEGTRVRVELPLLLAPAPPDTQPPPPRLRVVLLCRADSPHLPVLCDYLQPCFELGGVHDPREPADRQRLLHGAQLLLLLEDLGHPSFDGWLQTALPVLRLRPVEVMTDPAQQYLADCLPLPLRRRELLSACLRSAGAAGAVTCGGAQPAPRERFGLHCLVVEDNELNRRMIAAQLQDLGVVVSGAGSGQQALELLAQAGAELVLLDVHMPEMDGITLARHIRERYPRLPVYALTANVIGSEEEALAAAGVRAVLYKPLDELKLIELLRRHARAAPAFEIVVPPGIAAAEVRDDLQRLLALVERAMGDGDDTAAGDAAHQLLGAARMFTRGALPDGCLALELALREGAPARGAAVAAFGQLRELLARGDA